MKKLVLLFVLILSSGLLFAQQDPQFSQNMHNRLFPNPAVAGSNNAVCATLLGRYQWMQFSGRPETYLLSVHGPFKALKQDFGAGLSISQDKLGNNHKTLGAKVALAWRKPLGNGTIGVGIGGGIVNVSVDPFSDSDAIDGVSGDPSINKVAVSDMAADFDLGLYYQSDKLYVGFSSTHLSESELKGTDLSYIVSRHYYIMAGYRAELNQTFVLQPSIFAKTDASSTQVDINMTLMYKEQVWAGLSYRFTDAIVPMIGLMYPMGNGSLKFGYAYDITTSLLKQYSSGSHELMLSYCMGINEKNKVQRHKTVRFL
jgi:type IX secretion system PorP/SprF family membrane protein